VIADRGVLKKVPSNEWNDALFELHNAGRNPQPTQFQNVLRNFGNLLATHLPATGENPNELPDMPRFELK
jgi:putative membrane protein